MTSDASAMLSSFVVGVVRRSGQEATNAPMANRMIWRGTRLGRNHGIVDGSVVYHPTRNHASPDGRRCPTMFAMGMLWALLFSLRCVSGVSKNNFQSPRLHSCMQPGGLQQGKVAITGRSQGGGAESLGNLRVRAGTGGRASPSLPLHPWIPTSSLFAPAPPLPSLNSSHHPRTCCTSRCVARGCACPPVAAPSPLLSRALLHAFPSLSIWPNSKCTAPSFPSCCHGIDGRRESPRATLPVILLPLPFSPRSLASRRRILFLLPIIASAAAHLKLKGQHSPPGTSSLCPTSPTPHAFRKALDCNLPSGAPIARPPTPLTIPTIGSFSASHHTRAHERCLSLRHALELRACSLITPLHPDSTPTLPFNLDTLPVPCQTRISNSISVAATATVSETSFRCTFAATGASPITTFKAPRPRL